MPSSDDIEHGIQISPWFYYVAFSLMQNQDLINLGGEFQRQKVRLEKASSDKSVSDGITDIYQLDTHLEDMQTLLYNWIKSAYALSAKYLVDYLEKNNEFPTMQDDFLNTMKTFKPDYADWPVYRNVLNKQQIH